MRRLVLGPVLLASCFSEAPVDALPCVTDEGCGANEYQCVFGYCRPAGTDPLAHCGDGEASEGEYCYPTDGRVILLPETTVIEGVETYDPDRDGDLDFLVSTTDGMQLFTTNARGPGEPVSLTVMVSNERVLEVIPSLPASVPSAMIPVGEFGLGEFGGGEDRSEFVFELGELQLPPALQMYEPTLRRNLWLAEPAGGNNYNARRIVVFDEVFVFIEPGGIVAEDFDADGDDDLLVLYRTEENGPRRGMLFVATAVGELLAGIDVEAPGGTGTPEVHDIDGDGAIEIVIPSPADGQIAIMDDALRGMPMAPPTLVSIPPGARSIVIDDVDDNGQLDFVLAYADGTDEGRVLVKLSQGGLVYEDVEIPTVAAQGAGIADVDQNGALDVIVATGEDVYVYAGFPDFADWGVAVLVDESDIDGLRIFDWNNDGAPDLLTSKGKQIGSALADP